MTQRKNPDEKFGTLQTTVRRDLWVYAKGLKRGELSKILTEALERHRRG